LDILESDNWNKGTVTNVVENEKEMNSSVSLEFVSSSKCIVSTKQPQDENFTVKLNKDEEYHKFHPKELTIKNLLENDCCTKDICLGLDSQSNANWKRLLEILNKNQSLGESFQFESSYHGSPTMAMFEEIMRKCPRSSLSDLIDRLYRIRQNDVVVDLEMIKGAYFMKLEDLKIDEKLCLMKLDKEDRWELLAVLYNFKLEDRNRFKRARIQLNEWSPAKAVLKKLTEICPGFSLEEFKACLREMQRNDLANIIDDFITNEKRRQKKNSIYSKNSNY